MKNEEIAKFDSQLYWLHVPVTVSDGGFGELPTGHITVLGHPCQLFSRVVRQHGAASVFEQWFLFDPMPRNDAERLLESITLKIPALSIRVGPKSGVAFNTGPGNLEVSTNGSYNTNCPALIPAEFKPQPLTSRLSMHGLWNVNALLTGLEQCPEVRNQRLQLALELWETASRESASRSKFLTYMTILESLSTKQLRPEEVVAWISEKSDEAKKLFGVSLSGALKVLVNQSSSMAIQELVARAVFAMNGTEEEVAEKCALAKKLYGARSSLIHAGAPLKLGVEIAQELAGYVLGAALTFPNIVALDELTASAELSAPL